MRIWLYCTAGAMAGLAVCLLVAAAVSRRRRRRSGPAFRRGQVAPAILVGSSEWPVLGGHLPAGQPVFVPAAAPLPPSLPVSVVDSEQIRQIQVPLVDDRLWQGMAPPAAEADPPDPTGQADDDGPLADVPAGPLDADDPPADTAEPGSARLFNQTVHEFAEGGRLDPDQTELGRTTALIVARYRRPKVDDEGEG